QLPEHAAKAVDRIHMGPVRRARLEPDRVIGAEDVAGTIHQEYVVAFLDGAPRIRWDRGGRGGFCLGFGGSWHVPNVGPDAALINPPKKCGHRKCVLSRTSRHYGWRLLCRRGFDRKRFVTFTMDDRCALP